MTADPTYRGFALDAETALALLQWQAELGADEPCLDAAIDRYDLPERAAASRDFRETLARGLAVPAELPPDLIPERVAARLTDPALRAILPYPLRAPIPIRATSPAAG